MDNLNPQAIKAKKSDISPATAKKVTQISKCYLDAIFAARQYSIDIRQSLSAIATFITLTYPSVQQHTDDHTKRHHLGEFLKYLKRGALCRAYLWRAETQENGNIHFHILTDRYVHYMKVRNVWNSIISKDGYIEAFAQKHGHTSPNSTDIEAVHDADKAAAYISKYVAKGKTGRRLVNGRAWGCSDNIRDLRYYFEEDEQAGHTLNHIKSENMAYQKEISKYLTIYKNQKHNNYVSILDHQAKSRLDWHNLGVAWKLNLVT